MKKLIQLILLFAVLTVCADAKKLALIGDDKTCLLLTVELSKNDSIQLLERAEIKKVLREHKLSNSGLATSQLAKLFPHVDIFTIIREKRLIVFNAKDGFRLMDSNASKVQELAELIRMAVKKLSIQNPVYVSIVSVRDIGVPRRYKPKIKVFTRMLKQELMKQPNIQMLERSHLALVNNERELTAKRYNLKSSARLLTLEFEPGREAQIVNVKLLVRNLKNDLLNRIDAPDAFKDISKACKMLSSAVNGKAKVIVQSKAEAEQFYKEFLALRVQADKVHDEEYEKLNFEAMEKLETAIALAPENSLYRLEWLRYKMPKYRYNHFNEFSNKLLAKTCDNLIDEADRFKLDFPDKNGGYRAIRRVFSMLEAIYLTKDLKYQKYVKTTAARLQPKFYNDKYTREELLDSKVAPFVDMPGFMDAYFPWRPVYIHFFDDKKYVDAIIERKTREMKFLVKNHITPFPSVTYSELYKNIYWSKSFLETFFIRYPTHYSRQTCIRNIFLKSDPITNLALKHKDPAVQMIGIWLRIMKKMCVDPGNLLPWKNEFEPWLRNNRQKMPHWLRYNAEWITDTVSKNYAAYRFAQGLKLRREVMQARPVQARQGETSLQKLARQFKNIRGADKYRKQAQFIINNEQNFKNLPDCYQVPRKFSSSIELFYSIFARKKDKAFLHAIDILTTDFEIQQALITKFDIWSAAKYKNYICYNQNSNKFIIWNLFDNSKKIIKNSNNDIKFLRETIAGDGYFIVNGKDKLLVINAVAPEQNIKINDLPINDIKKVAILNKRIYLWGKGMLFSCNLNGKKRKIEMTDSRQQKRYDFEHLKSPRIIFMLPDAQRKRLLVHYYAIENGKSRCFMGSFFPHMNKFDVKVVKHSLKFVNRLDDNLYFSRYGAFISLNLQDDIKTILFSNYNKKAARYFPGKSIYYGQLVLRDKKRFWGKRICITPITGKNCNLTPLFLGKEGNYSWYFPYPDGKSLIYINAKVVYKITPKDKPGQNK